MLDIRLPIGLMFSAVGLIITIFGLATIGDVELYEKSLNVNVNLISGLGTLAFGLIMVLLSEPVRKKLRKKSE